MTDAGGRKTDDLDAGAYIGQEPERAAETIPGGVKPGDERIAAHDAARACPVNPALPVAGRRRASTERLARTGSRPGAASIGCRIGRNGHPQAVARPRAEHHRSSRWIPRRMALKESPVRSLTPDSDHRSGPPPLRIGIIAPPLLPLPPQGYAGTERVISTLALGLQARGHAVTVFAAGDSTLDCPIVPVVPRALWPLGLRGDPSASFEASLAAAWDRRAEFDILHSHVDTVGFPMARRSSVAHRHDAAWTPGPG